MMKLGFILAVASLVSGKSPWRYEAGPQFAPTYTVTGYILLPYCELREPFKAYYDEPSGKSRIDYYDGEMKTFQLAGDGSYKIVWSPNMKTHVPEQHCYASGETGVQSILPKLDGFKFVKSEPCYTDYTTLHGNSLRDSQCFRYESSTNNFGRVSTYVFWARQDEQDQVVPVRYMMMGYDSLLGSHFDKYEVIYTSYEAGAIDSDVFNVKQTADTECTDYPSPPGVTITHLLNPIREFVHNNDSHVLPHFDQFKADHGKVYTDEREARQREHNFRHNMRYVNSMNRRNLTYSLKLNQRSDWSAQEFKYLRGRLQSTNRVSEASPFPAHQFSRKPLPDYVDWRLEGAVSPVKDQAICGSCWSFGTVGHIEGAYFLKHGEMVRFSEQQLVDCSWSEGNDACDGGLDYIAYNYIKKYGLASDDQYGSYRGIDGKCHDTKVTKKPIETLSGYVNVSGVENLKKAIAYVGPISVAIDASRPSLSFYSHGVYKDPECSPTNLDHAVLAVGYGTLHGEPYWLIKNSWSTYWGNDGYILISQENNMCGVASTATYVEL